MYRNIDYYVGFTSKPESIDEFIRSMNFGFRSKDTCGHVHYGNDHAVYVVYTPADALFDSKEWTDRFKCYSPVCAIAKVEHNYEKQDAEALRIATKLHKKYSGSVLGQSVSGSVEVSVISSSDKHS